MQKWGDQAPALKKVKKIPRTAPTAATHQWIGKLQVTVAQLHCKINILVSRPLSRRNRRRRRIFFSASRRRWKKIRLGRLSWKFILAAAAEKLYG